MANTSSLESLLSTEPAFLVSVRDGSWEYEFLKDIRPYKFGVKKSMEGFWLSSVWWAGGPFISVWQQSEKNWERARTNCNL